jgi:aspartate aminotransferase
VIYSEPAWFCYEPMLLAANAVPRKVNCSRRRLTSILLQLIRPDVSTATRPLEALADLLERASSRIGHRIFLLSDEPYRPLRFDGRAFTSPAALFPWTLISRSYGKVLLAPGQRLGSAITPKFPAG